MGLFFHNSSAISTIISLVVSHRYTTYPLLHNPYSSIYYYCIHALSIAVPSYPLESMSTKNTNNDAPPNHPLADEEQTTSNDQDQISLDGGNTAARSDTEDNDSSDVDDEDFVPKPFTHSDADRLINKIVSLC